MAPVNVRGNWKKKTWSFVPNFNTDGRSGVKTYLGHWHTWVGPLGNTLGTMRLHFVREAEPDRPCALQLYPPDVYILRDMCNKFIAEIESGK